MKKTRAETLQTREHLLAAALEVFWRNGVSRASLHEIAQEAGVTRGALYWYFKNKENLFEELFRQNFEPVHSQMSDEVLHSVPDIWQHLHDTLLSIFKIIAENEQQQKFCNIIFLKCERTSRNRSITELAERYFNHHHTMVFNTLQMCHRRGRLPENIDLELAALFLNSSINGLLQLWIENPAGFDLVSAAGKILRSNLDTLQNGTVFLKDSAEAAA